MGLTWRHPTADDVSAWLRLLEAAEAVDKTGEHYTEDDLADEFTAPNMDPANGRFGFDESGEIGACGWAFGQLEASDLHRVNLWGTVRPDLRRRGVGRELLSWLEDRGREIHAALHPGGDGVLELRVTDDNPGQLAIAKTAGYEPMRYWFEMRRELAGQLPAREAPAGIDIVPFSPALDAAVRDAHNEAFADHWGSTPRSEHDWRLWYVGRNFRPDLSFIALANDDVAGYLVTNYFAADAAASGRPEGWVNAVGTRRPWRGRGVAQALLAAALHAYRAAGFERAALGVDAANPSGALKLYERLGFRTTLTTISYAKPV